MEHILGFTRGQTLPGDADIGKVSAPYCTGGRLVNKFVAKYKMLTKNYF